MDFVTVRDLRVTTSQVWEKLKNEKELVVTLNGRPFALLSNITGSNLETVIRAVRKARGESALRKLRQSAKDRGLDKISEAAIREEVRKYRNDTP